MRAGTHGALRSGPLGQCCLTRRVCHSLRIRNHIHRLGSNVHEERKPGHLLTKHWLRAFEAVLLESAGTLAPTRLLGLISRLVLPDMRALLLMTLHVLVQVLVLVSRLLVPRLLVPLLVLVAVLLLVVMVFLLLCICLIRQLLVVLSIEVLPENVSTILLA